MSLELPEDILLLSLGPGPGLTSRLSSCLLNRLWAPGKRPGRGHMGKGGVEVAPGGVKKGLKLGGMAPCGGWGIPAEVGVLEGGGMDSPPELAIMESPLGGTMEFGGAELGEEVLIKTSFLSPFFWSSIIPFTLSISATLRRAGSSS